LDNLKSKIYKAVEEDDDDLKLIKSANTTSGVRLDLSL
jgi:hypothetical protein